MSVSVLSHNPGSQSRTSLSSRLRVAGKSSLRVLSLVSVLAAVGCASSPWYEEAPLTPEAISPEIHAVKTAGQDTTFKWSRTENTEYYEFHIFNGETTDIEQYMTINLLPNRICNEQQCSLTLSLDLPVSERHAWRVRAGNMAGLSTWTRNLFTISAVK